MGYPMDYRRVINRNYLKGDYDGTSTNILIAAICGDLRRLEKDQRDNLHLACYAEACNVTPIQAKAVLDAFFEGDVETKAPNAVNQYFSNQKIDVLEKSLIDKDKKIAELEQKINQLTPFSTLTNLQFCDKHKGMSYSSELTVSYNPNFVPIKSICPICDPPKRST